MNTVLKSLLQKGAIAISVSAFVGFVYASQVPHTLGLPAFLGKAALLEQDSPPPKPRIQPPSQVDTDTASSVDTRIVAPVKATPADTGQVPIPVPKNNNNTTPNNPNNPNSTTNPNNNNPNNTQGKKPDSTQNQNPRANTNPVDTNKLRYPIAKEGEGHKSSFDFNDPLKKDVTLDSSMTHYTISHRAGNTGIDSSSQSFKDYQDAQNKQWMQDYFKRRSEAQVSSTRNGLLPKLNLNTGTPLDNLAKLVTITPNGSAQLIFSEDFSRVKNPTYSLNEQNTAQFKFDQKIQVSVIAAIGDRVKFNFRYDTQASFDFENQKKLSYQGKDDEIIKSIEAGDVTFPVSGSLITGSQSLFGVKTKLQFGKLDVSAIFAQEKADQKEITLQGGAQVNNFKITCDNYDANRNFLLAQYFVNHYDQFNANWPAVSNIQITKVEVWVTNTGASTTNTRNIAAFLDLGESQPYNHGFVTNPNNNPNALPDNYVSSGLYQTLRKDTFYRSDKSIANELAKNGTGAANFQPTRDYYVLENARELQPTEFTINTKLGYISLNQQLNPSDVLGVAFQYTVDGKTYQVGEFAEDIAPNVSNPNVLFVKMLKSVAIDPRIPNWKLMMKNIYSLGAYQVSSTNFKFQVVYDNAKTGARLNYLPEPEIPGMNGTPIIRLLGLDKVNSQLQAEPDGNFDYIEGVTINSAQGRVIFPVLEPFGQDMKKLFRGDTVTAAPYVYQLLYDSTHTFAIQDQTHNKYTLEGSFQGTAGNVISLNSINVPQGSVKVFANGVPLVEGTDFTVDYQQGRVTIINQSILNSGAVIKVTSESNSLFSIQQKTLMGTHLDYHFDKKFTMGGTFLYLNERPLTTIVNVGSEPVSNAIFGFDGHYNTDSKMLTDAVNKIPLLNTKEKSTFTADGEYAQIIPGYPSALNASGTKGGLSYIDDFEGSIVPYDLRLGNNWVLSSVPQGQPSRFPEADLVNDLSYGYRRSKMAWYIIDNTFYENISGTTAPNILGNNTLLSDPYQRMVHETEVFPNEQLPAGTPDILQTFDMIYRPGARGPYNFNTSRLNSWGRFKDPGNSWAGIQRSLPTTDFEDANIQYVEMWMMDPYQTTGLTHGAVRGEGTMDVDLGTISEDILHDNRESWENGLTCDGSGEDATAWGRVPNTLHITTSFNNDPTTRPCQDIGYDGLGDDSERVHFATFLTNLKKTVNPQTYTNIDNDPSGDNFHFFRGVDFDNANYNIIQRYMEFNGVEGNTPESVGGDNGYGTLNPDDEDINHDFNIETSEAYYEYEVKIDPRSLNTVGSNYVTDIQSATVTTPNGKQVTTKWYQLKIPINEYSRVVGPISDFKSIRFMRIYLSGFTDSVILRFARLQLVRGDWRKYLYSLDAPGDPLPTDTVQSNLDVSAISLEADGNRPGIRYVLPPGIQRQIDYSTPSLTQQNEQSLDLKICGLKEGESRAIYKNFTVDIRQYKNLNMFVHCEANGNKSLKDGDLHLFLRVGADYTQNYYELDIPLQVTNPSGSGDVNATWPAANTIALAMAEWVSLKTQRNAQGGSLTVPYTANATSTPGQITVVGNPDVGDITSIMIGLRHPKNKNGPTACAEVWVDELRVSGYNDKGGWAATGRVTAKLADFGRVELSAAYQTIGFGSIDQTLQQRNIQNMESFGLLSSFQLGNFFPKSAGVKIPMFFSYSQQVNTPEYNPLSPDQPLTTLTNQFAGNKVKQDSVINAAEDFTSRKSLNFTAVHKERKQNAKPHIYDIENFNFTYIYSEIDRHNITSLYDNQTTYSGQLVYAYNFNPKTVEPFQKMDPKYLKLLKDFNFYYLPQQFNFVAKLDREFDDKLYRNTDDYQSINMPLYNKTFTFTRKYDFRHNFTRSLRLTYSATALSRIDEPYGNIDSSYKNQIIWHNILSGGTPTDFSQNTALDYEVPINKLPFLDFTQLHANYTAAYEWKGAPPIGENLGNTIQNSQTIAANASVTMLTLYNRSKYLRNIITGVGNTKADDTEDDSTKDKKGKPGLKNIRAKKTNTPKPKVNDPNANHLTTGETLIGLLMSLRTATVSYTINNGTALPGFLPTPQHFGENFQYNAPGLPFIFGSQADLRNKAVQRGWLSNDTNLSQQYITSQRKTLLGSASLEPIKNLKIKVDVSRNQTTSFSETFRNTPDSGFQHLSPIETGNYSISVISLASAFKPNNKDGSNVIFTKFLNSRLAVARTLARQSGVSTAQVDSFGYPIGYSKTHQDVLIPAFLQAYTGMNTGINEFPQIPMPNWSITYTGLSNYPFFKSFAKQVSLTSGYHSTYTVSNYTSNLDYLPNTIDESLVNSTNFISQYRIDGVSLSERWDPLIGIDMTLKDNWSGSASFSKQRSESLTFVDQRITENKTSTVTLGIGYVTNKFYLPFTGRGKARRYLKNELKFRLDVQINDNEQEIWILDQSVGDATGGQLMIAILPNITYTLNKNLTLNIFLKQNMTSPYTSNQYPTSLTSIGFSLKYILTP